MKVTIKFRLIATMALLGLLIVITGLSGLYGMQKVNLSLQDANDNTMPSAIAIGESQLALARSRLALDRVTMHPELPDSGKTLARAESFMTASDKAWARYLALPQNDEEKRLSDQMDKDRKAFADQGFMPLVRALNAKDTVLADKITMTVMQPLFAKLSESAQALSEFQSKSNTRQYDASQALYSTQRWLTGGAIVGGLVLMLAAAVSLLRSILVPIRESVTHFARMADGDLSNRIDVRGNDEMTELMRALEGMQSKLAATVLSVRNGAASIATATAEIATGNLDLSGRTEEQAASLEETASSLEELTSTVRQNSENARQSNELAQEASRIAARGGEVVGNVINTMESIRAASTRIADIIGVIDGIAFQTNILALNAAVEAARAGEQGRGFAVVASEVRSLAHRSADAAKDIKALIGASVTQVDGGVSQVREAGSTMGEIVASIERVTGIMVEISAAGHEQELGISQINQAVATLDATTQQNAALVEEAAAASASLSEQAARLSESVAAFKLDGGGVQRSAAPRGGASRPVSRPLLAHA
ncbi:methyl-accepting chemotaxis protein [Duganella levis]|uniref:HAMP domain-containing protein n=1 Tax=Duganella levis TaxID=2692169 RepID=A0ABW9VXW0_9BURK|nr:methyl-accepting chemotaxis protein [Duganella levis]MYN26485.1 HAMP domain-containing protein [Duganella levis]